MVWKEEERHRDPNYQAIIMIHLRNDKIYIWQILLTKDQDLLVGEGSMMGKATDLAPKFVFSSSAVGLEQISQLTWAQGSLA